MDIFVSRPLPDAVCIAARALGSVTVRTSTDPLSRAEMIAALETYDVILPTLRDAFSADIFEGAKGIRCKMMANFGVGFNHIDIAAANSKGIVVSNTPGAVTDATADIGMSLILMAARRLSEGERMLRQGDWSGWHPTQMLGLHVTGKTVGIIGMGRIGQAIARRCHFGFGMDVRYVNRSAKDLEFPAVKMDTLQALAAQCDVIVVALPANENTHHLIDASVFNAMQKHAYFVNIARGDIVNEADLIDALQRGTIAGAGLDVYEFEPKVPPALIAMENVVLLPHLGTASLEVRTQMGLMAVENIAAFVNGGDIPNRV